MKSVLLVIAVALSFQFLAGSTASADDALSGYRPMLSRNSDGSLTIDSVEALQHMRRAASRNGKIVVWLTLSSTYWPPYAGQLSPEELAEQDARVVAEYREILRPLLHRRQAKLPQREYEAIEGPSIPVQLTKAGLDRLADDKRVGQIAAAEPL